MANLQENKRKLKWRPFWNKVNSFIVSCVILTPEHCDAVRFKKVPLTTDAKIICHQM